MSEDTTTMDPAEAVSYGDDFRLLQTVDRGRAERVQEIGRAHV